MEGIIFVGILSVFDDIKVVDLCDFKEVVVGEVGYCINSVDIYSVMGNEVVVFLKGIIEIFGEVVVDMVMKSDLFFDFDDDFFMIIV